MKRASSLLALTLLLCCPGLPAAAATPSKGKGVSWIDGKSFPFLAYSPEDIFLRIFAEKEIKNNSLTKRYAEKGIKATAYVCDQAFAVIKKRPNAPRERVSSVLSSKLIEKVVKDREFFNSAWISVGAFSFVCPGVILPSDLHRVVTELQQIDRTKFSKFTHAAFHIAWNQWPLFYKDSQTSLPIKDIKLTPIEKKLYKSLMRSILISSNIRSAAKGGITKDSINRGQPICKFEKSKLMRIINRTQEDDLALPRAGRINAVALVIADIQLNCNISFSTQELRSLFGKNYVTLPR